MTTDIELSTVYREKGEKRLAGLHHNEAGQSNGDEHPMPKPAFPFTWGECWKQCIEYKVDDFAAEIGFFIDFLGLETNALAEDYAMFTGPQRDFFFSIVPAGVGEASTPPESIKLQFMISDLRKTVDELERRGIRFKGTPNAMGAMETAEFCSPHGICITLWAMAN